ncbi:MAG TPA: MBL fold metallo-hydrolase [Opitutales bacterium]|nr:MBL fold metallo-hydrolase [Opitutales bacterium]
MITKNSSTTSVLRQLASKPTDLVQGFKTGWGFKEPDTAVIDKKRPHHTSRGFQNLYPHARHNFRDFFRWQLRLGEKDPLLVPPHKVPRRYVPTRVTPDLGALRNPDPDRLQVTWIGHTTFLIQANGLNILTDPIFSDRCSPVQFVGPRRKAAPGLQFSQLPPIDAVVISHDHYDHLDNYSIQILGDTPRYFFPLGISRWFQRRGLTNFEEKDWGESVEFEGMRLHCLPAQHFSGRTLFDRNRTLWCSWMLEIGDKKVYFLGDTGYAPFFEEVGEQFGAVDCALIPIGAYRPRWYMQPVHVDAREAVQIHKDIRSQFSIASHWGTFALAEEPPAEPPIYLRRALVDEGLETDEFQAVRFGETVELTSDEK